MENKEFVFPKMDIDNIEVVDVICTSEFDPGGIMKGTADKSWKW